MPVSRLPLCILVLVCQWFASGPANAQNPVIARAMDAVLVLYSDDSRADFLGSGFLYGNDGIALTNAHVVNDAKTVTAAFRDGHIATADVIAKDATRDIALLQFRDQQAHPGLTASAGFPSIGTPIIALGAPLGLGFSATSGIIAATPRQVETTVPLRLLQHDAALNPGSSGGPLISATGRLVGMNSQIADGSRYYIGISYAIAATDLARLVPQMLTGTITPIPHLGLDARPVTTQIAAALGTAPKGLLVEQVLPDSAAKRAGLQAGDILLSLDGQAIDTPGDLPFGLEAIIGPATGFEILRAGQPMALQVDLIPPKQSPIDPQLPLARTAYSLAGLDIALDADNRVTEIAQTSLALRDGLMIGDVILSLNGTPPDPQTQFTNPALLLVRSDGTRTRHILLDPWSTHHSLRPIGNGNVIDPAVERF